MFDGQTLLDAQSITLTRLSLPALLRSNLSAQDPARLWQFYVQLTQVEAAFKDLKDDLSLRPIFHQLEHRITASARVLPCEMQPGSAGHSATNIPSSSGSSTTRYFMQST